MSKFGPEFEQIWPVAGSALKLSSFGRSLLQKCQTIEKPDVSRVNIKDFVKKSSNFPVEFGTNTCRVMSQPKDRYPIIEQQIASAYPVIHERVLTLYLAFLEHMCKYGNDIERRVYEPLTLTGFVQRLLKQRCATFCGPRDHYKLVTGETSFGGFQAVGTTTEKPPLTLQNVLSYDEMKLSALLSVSSHTEFLNDGNRNNNGKIEPDKSKIVPQGVVVGLIGGRFEVLGVMEMQDIVITDAQNTKERGYGAKELLDRASDYRRLWNEFYETGDYLYPQALAALPNPRLYKPPRQDLVFDNLVMKRRYTMSFDTLLLDAEARAAAAGQQAYIHVVGIGLGVWKAVSHQVEIFLEAFGQRLQTLLPQLSHVAAAHFSWFHLSEWGVLKDGGLLKSDTHPAGGIRIFLSNRNPADKLAAEFENSLVIVSYAWDGNALPGNEFWMGALNTTGDSSTACSTLVSELHNPHINEEMVNGENLHVATPDFGVQHISEYSKRVLK